MINDPISQTYTRPLLPLRDIVIFPGMVAPLFVGRKKSIIALEEVVNIDHKILLSTQKDANKDDPLAEDMHEIGLLGKAVQLLRLPDGTVKVLVEGGQRVRITRCYEAGGCFRGNYTLIDDVIEDESQMKAMTNTLKAQFERYASLNKKISAEVKPAIEKIETPGVLIDTIAAHLTLKIEQKQVLLEISNLQERLEKVFSYMEAEIEVLDAEQRIRENVKKNMDRTHKEYYLNEQLKAIHKELGEKDGKDEIEILKDRVAKTKLSKEAKEKCEAELKKLKVMAPMSAEASVVRNYLDWILELPWNIRKKTKNDIQTAEKILNEDHYSLERVKERILEYLAVQQRMKKVKGPVLCLVGPPGVGKTSLARSIARAVDREFIKISLGGVRDEAEIRGHRRTYIGAMPGKIIQSLKKAKTNNPLFLLDEIDKMGTDFRGDPASALLEVLDPEQNANFNDHYLEIDYDLSDVMFVTTSNSFNIPGPLLDRLEVIRLSGYTEDEKFEIAKRHLIPKKIKEHGLKKTEWELQDSALQDLIRYYTREAGVRNLEREIAKVARKALRKILVDKSLAPIVVNSDNIKDYAGVRKYSFGETEMTDLVGIVNGLAYTEFGGDILTIEAVQMPGTGNIKCTGKLGDVMQESAQAAFSYLRSRCTEYGITPPHYRERDIHLHVPEGATPKDGPSAGVAMFTALVSVLTGIPISRTVAMTGEITLRGRVLPIGGLKEKLLAALRGGVKTVLVPKENEKDMEEIPDNVKKGLNIIFIANADEAIKATLMTMPDPVEWNEELEKRYKATLLGSNPQGAGAGALAN